MREGDIESLRRRAKEEGRPIRSTTVIDKDGTRIHYTEEKGKVKITGKNT